MNQQEAETKQSAIINELFDKNFDVLKASPANRSLRGVVTSYAQIALQIKKQGVTSESIEADVKALEALQKNFNNGPYEKRVALNKLGEIIKKYSVSGEGKGEYVTGDYLMQITDKDDEKRKESLNRLKNSVGSMNTKIESIVDISTLQSATPAAASASAPAAPKPEAKADQKTEVNAGDKKEDVKPEDQEAKRKRESQEAKKKEYEKLDQRIKKNRDTKPRTQQLDDELKQLVAQRVELRREAGMNETWGKFTDFLEETFNGEFNAWGIGGAAGGGLLGSMVGSMLSGLVGDIPIIGPFLKMIMPIAFGVIGAILGGQALRGLGVSDGGDGKSSTGGRERQRSQGHGQSVSQGVGTLHGMTLTADITAFQSARAAANTLGHHPNLYQISYDAEKQSPELRLIANGSMPPDDQIITGQVLDSYMRSVASGQLSINVGEAVQRSMQQLQQERELAARKLAEAAAHRGVTVTQDTLAATRPARQNNLPYRTLPAGELYLGSY